MNSKTIKGTSAEEIKSAYFEYISDDFEPTLALLFLSVEQDIEGINIFFTEQQIDVFGSSTLGEINEDEIMYGSISVLLLEINPAFFKIYFEEYELATAHLATKRIAERAISDFSDPSFLIASSQFEINYVQFLKGITDVAGNETLVYGAIAGDKLTFVNGVVFNINKRSAFGLIALVFDNNKIEMNGTTICGWNSLGMVKTFTESKRSRIFKVDDKTITRTKKTKEFFKCNEFGELNLKNKSNALSVYEVIE
ncbi:MAG: hypothetical protein HN778_14170 [Prolixibacteraceae bacterium]|jgi:hypothetical protein|nr:hypothetical protein [Prolixibacteraceae bacterium]MBT6767270.1 hypothetical protein [Prolixibacteraceae bacterium]MBT6999160.1 hypothetical protein [Prolixibacteraceae bacterium]MBT7395973.1 hypothetical protein [Prolixibacteraceae bacterium]